MSPDILRWKSVCTHAGRGLRKLVAISGTAVGLFSVFPFLLGLRGIGHPPQLIKPRARIWRKFAVMEVCAVGGAGPLPTDLVLAIAKLLRRPRSQKHL